MSQPRITVVEDEEPILEVLTYNLGRAGFVAEGFKRGDEGWAAIRANPPDLVILDIMLPGIDGLEIVRLMRRESATAAIPILLLTARAEEVDRIVGLELGADDYLAKPFSPREVVLRVKAILRRSVERPAVPAAESSWLDAGAIRLDPEGHRVTVEGEEVALTATELRLLRILLERRGRTQSRATLLSEVWGYAEDVDSRTVDTHIRRLRKKLGSEAHRVETLIGVGYRLKP